MNAAAGPLDEKATAAAAAAAVGAASAGAGQQEESKEASVHEDDEGDVTDERDGDSSSGDEDDDDDRKLPSKPRLEATIPREADDDFGVTDADGTSGDGVRQTAPRTGTAVAAPHVATAAVSKAAAAAVSKAPAAAVATSSSTPPRVRKKRQRYTLDQLEEIATQVRHEDNLNVDEKQRQMGIVYSKRKRLRAKIREQHAENERDDLLMMNDQLRRENGRLELLLREARRIVEEFERTERVVGNDRELRRSREAAAATAVAAAGIRDTEGRRRPPDLLWHDEASQFLPTLRSPRGPSIHHHHLREMRPGLALRGTSPTALQSLSGADLLRLSSTQLHRQSSSSSTTSPTSLRSLHELQLLGRLPDVPPSAGPNAMMSSSMMFDAAPISSTSFPSTLSTPPDLAQLSRSYGMLQQRLRGAQISHDIGGEREERRHLNALLSASLLPNEASAASALLPSAASALDLAASDALLSASGTGGSLDSLLDGLRSRWLPPPTTPNDLSLTGLLRHQQNFPLSEAATASASARARAATTTGIGNAATALSVASRLALDRLMPIEQSAQSTLHQQLLLSQHNLPASALLLRAPHEHVADDFDDADTIPADALRLLPAHERLLLSRVDTMASSDLLALFRHWKVASPVAAELVARCLRRRLRMERRHRSDESSTRTSAAAAANPTDWNRDGRNQPR